MSQLWEDWFPHSAKTLLLSALPNLHTTADSAADPLQTRLLRALANGQRVSGAELAAQTGISRAAIWKRIERLRQQGLDLIAQPGKGYQLRHPVDLLDGDAITFLLATSPTSGIDKVEVHWQLDSTNSWLMHGYQADRSGTAVLAEIQTAGRGRRGRIWRSNIGGSLTLSLAWQFERGMSALAGLSVVVGIAVIDALTECGINGASVKWPNDVQVDGRKLAGILVEVGGEAQGPCHAVIGIGLNIRLDPATASEIDQDWTDLATMTGSSLGTPSRNALAAAILASLSRALQRFERDGFAPFADDFARYDALLGRELRIIGSGGDSFGVASGIDARGALRVRSDDGKDVLVDSGEVSIRTT